MCAYMCAWFIYRHICTYTALKGKRPSTVHMYAPIHICMYVCVRICVYGLYIGIYAHIQHLKGRDHPTYAYPYTYIHTYIHTSMYTSWRPSHESGQKNIGSLSSYIHTSTLLDMSPHTYIMYT